MLPQSHVAYTWLAASLAQEHLDADPDIDFRLLALAAMGPDLIDKPLAWLYFYERFKSAVLFAHTLIVHLAIAAWMIVRWPYGAAYGLAFAGHALLDRLWLFPNTFYWPLRGWRFHVWGQRGSEQEKIGWAYWYAFTRRPELWGWEAGGILAFALFAMRHRLYLGSNLRDFILTGKAPARR